MGLEKPTRRLPLRDLLTDTERRAGTVAEHIGTTWVSRVAELRRLSRPLRHKSHYPTLLTLKNSLHALLELTCETDDLLDSLERQLDEIRHHARQERLERG